MNQGTAALATVKKFNEEKTIAPGRGGHPPRPADDRGPLSSTAPTWRRAAERIIEAYPEWSDRRVAAATGAGRGGEL